MESAYPATGQGHRTGWLVIRHSSVCYTIDHGSFHLI